MGWVLAYTCIIFSLYMIEFCLFNNTQNCIKILNQYFPSMDAESFSMRALSKHYSSLGCMLLLQAEAVVAL